MHRLHSRALRDETGIALLIAVILLLLISAIGIASLQHAQQEASSSGRSRHHARNLQAGEGLLQLVVQQLMANSAQNREDPLDIAQFIQDPTSGVWMSASTTAPADAGMGTPTPRGPLRTGSWVRSGDAIGGPIRQQIYNVNVFASDPSGARVALQAQYALLDAVAGGGYQ